MTMTAIFTFIIITILFLLCLNLYLKVGNLTNKIYLTNKELSKIFMEIDKLLLEHENDVKKLKGEMKYLVSQHELKEHNNKVQGFSKSKNNNASPE